MDLVNPSPSLNPVIERVCIKIVSVPELRKRLDLAEALLRSVTPRAHEDPLSMNTTLPERPDDLRKNGLTLMQLLNFEIIVKRGDVNAHDFIVAESLHPKGSGATANQTKNWLENETKDLTKYQQHFPSQYPSRLIKFHYVGPTCVPVDRIPREFRTRFDTSPHVYTYAQLQQIANSARRVFILQDLFTLLKDNNRLPSYVKTNQG